MARRALSYEYVTDGKHFYQRVPKQHVLRSSYYVRIPGLPKGAKLDGLPPTERMFRVEKDQYVRVHRSVLEVDCPFCQADQGELCTGAYGQPVRYRHARRAAAARELLRQQELHGR